MTLTQAYIAAPFFSKTELAIVEDVETILETFHISYFSPRSLGPDKPEDLREPSIRKRINQKNLFELGQASFVLALIDRLHDDPTTEIWLHRQGTQVMLLKDKMDDGTLWECGYAKALNIPVILYTTSLLGEHTPNIMLSENCKGIIRGRRNLEAWAAGVTYGKVFTTSVLELFEAKDYR